MPFSVPSFVATADSTDKDTLKLRYPIKDKPPYGDKSKNNPFDLKNPSGQGEVVEYDPATNSYTITDMMGDEFYRDPEYLSFDEYLDRESEREEGEYWKQRSRAANLLEGRSVVPKLQVSNKLFDRIFGGSTVDIRPQGTIDLTFGGQFQKYDNPLFTERQRRTGGFDFDMNIQMNVIGKIGEKLKVTTNYNTQATFDFENQFKLEYTGFEDEIIQSIEAGNVSLPLKGSLIQGSQSLFGLKTSLQFGRLTVTSILTQQKGEAKEIEIEGGAQTQSFSIDALDYDVNRHYFLNHYFRDNYNRALQNLPIINSAVNINRIEVWVTNYRGATQNTRDIVGYQDLAENNQTRILNPSVIAGINETLPRNESNNLYREVSTAAGARTNSTVISTLTSTSFSLPMETPKDFEKTFARQLNPSEYTYHAQLGYISLNQSLNPEDVLAVAYEYTTNTGAVYQVGEFSQDVEPGLNNSSVLHLKLLKSSSINTTYPIWDLMMKNVYSLGAFQVSNEDFMLNIHYLDPGGGERRYIPEGTGVQGIPLIRLMNLDRLNGNNDAAPDGMFDYVPGVTILPSNGRVIFPVVEPFGEDLRAKFAANEQAIADKYIFQQLYDTTQTAAEQFPELNRYSIEGTYKSSVSSEISLGFNISPGSVVVTAGGQQLTEGTDYIVDYSLGRIRVVNEAYLNSGIPIKVSFEDKALFGIQTKTLFGTRLDYWINDDFTLGGTFLHLSERPFTNKVNIGDEPISNSVFGLDGTYHTDAPWITKYLDKLPLIDTKEPSSVTLTGEFARLVPGHSKAIDNPESGEKGIAYIDDFEGTESSYRLEFPYFEWNLASTPQNALDPLGNDMFPEAQFTDSLVYGMNRAKLAWYTIDPLFLRNTNGTPDHLTKDDQSNHYVREIQEREVFPNRENPNQITTTIPTFDLAFYPTERGPYNFDATRINNDGSLQNPEDRWGGIMRQMDATDFEAANIEFIEFWMLDPFLEQPDGTVNNTGGELYFQLGNISEDILRDSKKFFENGIPRPGSLVPVDNSAWGIVPTTQPITNAFDNDPAVRAVQDVGLDGLADPVEVTHFADFLASLPGSLTANARAALQDDPSSDNYHYYLGDDYDEEGRSISDRYKHYNNPHGNSEITTSGTPTAARNTPDAEDFNNDNTLTEIEEYFQYNLRLTPASMNVGENYIVNVQPAEVDLENGNTETVNWYQFRVPVVNYDNKVGNIADFKSIRFIRMFMRGWQESAFMRFARLEMVRNQWRRYNFNLQKPGEYIPGDIDDNTTFDVSSVNIEENSERDPVNYILPPGIQREQVPGQVSNFFQNEQALSVRVCDLEDGDARAVYKALNLDMRTFKRVRMYIHAEADPITGALQTGELRAFMRIGTDFTENYYEYEIPLHVTPAGNYNSDLESNQQAVWPPINNLDIAIEDLVQVKIERNNITNWPRNKPYTKQDAFGNRITVVGSPDLGRAENIMLGVLNPKSDGSGDDDGLPKCGEVWFNELRLTEFDERGGYAALARMDVKLADLGNFTLSGNMHSIGWGSLEQNLADRAKDKYHQYDAALNIELGRLFKKEAGFIIPTHLSYSRAVSTPQFDPYNSDVLLETMLASSSNPDSLKRIAQDITTIRSINFTNVRKVSASAKPGSKGPWDSENFDLTYAYSETRRSNPTIQSDLVKKYKAGFGYRYTIAPLFIKPFNKIIGDERKALALVKNFNVNPIPTSYTFRTEMNRQIGRTQLRKLNPDDLPIEPTFDKDWTWDRMYGMSWDFTKSMKLDVNASNRARIDEPRGEVDTQAERDSIWNNIEKFGRTTDYNHSANLNYTMPLKMVPFLDWTQVRTSYAIQYNWQTAPFQGVGIDTIGNTISNTQSRSINGDLNFKNLYNKSKFLRKYNRAGSSPRRPVSQSKGAAANEDDKDKKKKKKKKKGQRSFGEVALETGARAIISLKKITVNYTESFGTVLPGYKHKTEFMGSDFGGHRLRPGWEFISGYQPDLDWLEKRAREGMFITNDQLSYQFNQNKSENLNIKATLEPMKDMRADFTFTRDLSFTSQRYFQVEPESLEFESINEYTSGSFSVSFIAWSTMFDKPDENGDNLTDAFRNFSNYRQDISARLGSANIHSTTQQPDSITGALYSDGYGAYSQDVLIPAFMAAYTGKTPDKVPLNVDKMFKMTPRPNWRLTYNGLSKLKPLEKLVQSINLSHGYISTFTIGGFTTNVNYIETFGSPVARDPISGNFESQYTIQNISITEQLSPLLGVDVTWKNGLTTRVEMRRTRNLMMSFTDFQLQETKSSEFTIGVGYRFKDFPLPFSGGKKKLENDMNFVLDFSINNNKTTKYILDQNVGEPTSGATTVRIAPSLDYVVNDRVNVRIFYDRQDNIPATSASFRQTNTNVGINVRFTLAQ